MLNESWSLDKFHLIRQEKGTSHVFGYYSNILGIPANFMLKVWLDNKEDLNDLDSFDLKEFLEGLGDAYSCKQTAH